MANTGCAESAIAVAPICLNFGITAPVLSCVITWRGRIETKSPLRTCVPGASPSACRAAIFSTSVRPISVFQLPANHTNHTNKWTEKFASIRVFRGRCFSFDAPSLFRGAFSKHVRDGDALPDAGIQMLHEGHVDVAGQQGELYRAQLGEGPALAAAARGDGLAPDRGDLFAQRPVLDLPDARKELRDLSDSVDGRFVCFHGG